MVAIPEKIVKKLFDTCLSTVFLLGSVSILKDKTILIFYVFIAIAIVINALNLKTLYKYFKEVKI